VTSAVPRSSRALRPLAAVFLVLANIFVLLAAAYLFLGRADLPTFFPHARAAGQHPTANDAAMAAVMLGCAGALAYASYYARSRRSWLRTHRWHRKHGRA
jgi:O-antigen/teichoic acid export membrane protein